MSRDELEAMTEGWTADQFRTYILNYSRLAEVIQMSGGCVWILDSNNDLRSVMKMLAANHITITAEHDFIKTNP